MANNLSPTLEKKLLNRNAPFPNTDRSFNNNNISTHDNNAHRRSLSIGPGIRIQGNIEDVETLMVEGTIDTPTIKVKKLIIQRAGIFRGEVEAQDVEITGTLEGNIVVQGNLFVTSTGRLVGKALCRRLKVDDGGHITGQVEMITSDKINKPAQSEPEQQTSSTASKTPSSEPETVAEELLKPAQQEA